MPQNDAAGGVSVCSLVAQIVASGSERRSAPSADRLRESYSGDAVGCEQFGRKIYVVPGGHVNWWWWWQWWWLLSLLIFARESQLHFQRCVLPGW